MKKFIFIVVTLLTACVAKREVATLPKSVTCNAEFQILWEDYVAETKKFSEKNYKPSEIFIEKYNLAEQNGDFYISGHLYVNEKFSRTEFEKIGGSLVDYGNGHFTFRIPIKNLEIMIKINGIERVELAKKVNLKIK